MTDLDNPELVATTDLGLNAACALDSDGRKSVFWYEDVEGRQSLASARSTGVEAWSQPQIIATDDVANVTTLTSVDSGDGGETVVTYLRFDGVGDQLWTTILR
jgi:hypothetical protein